MRRRADPSIPVRIKVEAQRMSTVGIETAQNVVIHHEVASVGDRMVAWILDFLVKAAWFLLFTMVFFIIDLDDYESQIIYWTLVALPMSFYHLASELLMDGKSIGKSSMNIKVARLDGGQPTLGQYLLRWLIGPFDVWFYGIGLVVILINGRGQRLGDLAAGTTVVSLKQRTKLTETLLTEVREEHQVRFPEVTRLTDAQAALVKEVVTSTKQANRWALMEEMAAKVREATGITGDGMKAMEFLQVVLRDYVHLTGQQGAGTGHFKGERVTSPSPTDGAPR